MHSEGARGGGVAAILACPVSSSAVRAEAGPPRVELRYVVTGTAQGCPSTEQFRANVARELTFDAFGADPNAVVSVTIEDL